MMQVYSGDKLVGMLDVDQARIFGRSYQIDVAPPLFLSHWDDDAETISNALEIRRLSLQIRTRRFRLDNRDMMLMRGGAEAVARYLEVRGVPSYADKDLDLLRDATIYSWPAFDIDKDLHEELFDLDIFEPV